MNPLAWSVLMLVVPLVSGCTPERQPCKFVLPEGYEGAATIVWGNLGSPALPTEGGLLVAEIPKDGLLKTSTPLQAGKTTRDELYWRKGTELVAIPQDKRADRTTGSYRSCGEVEQLFIGDKGKLATMKSEVEARLDPVCSGAIAMTSSTAASTAAPIYSSPTVDPEVGIGMLRLGMARADLDRLGFPVKEGAILEVGPYRVSLDEGRVAAIEITLPAFPQGVRIGTDPIPPTEKDVARIAKQLRACGKVDVTVDTRAGKSEMTCADGTAHVKAVGPDGIVLIDVMTKAHAAQAGNKPAASATPAAPAAPAMPAN